MKIKMHPSKGIDDLRFGMQFDTVVELAARYGRVKEWPGTLVGPETPPGSASPRKAVVSGRDYEVVLLGDDNIHLTGVEIFRPRGAPSEVTVRYEGLDVFRTPARELADLLSGLGREVVWEGEDEMFKVPDETLVIDRDTGQDVEMDPRDDLPLYPSYVLVGPKNYYERGLAWLNGEALYTHEE